jgi:hypothetical protein
VAERWGIYIDVEGFRSFVGLEQLRAMHALGDLMVAIFRVGRHCYPEPPDRITAHQFGDGFIVMSDSHEQLLDRCVAIAAAVMRHVAMSGSYARAAIAEGDLADVQGCYPDEVMSCRESNCSHRISLHMGLMTITTVMGTALTRAVALAEAGKPCSSGPLLLIESDKCGRLGSSVPRQAVPGCPEIASIDWVHMRSPLLAAVQDAAALNNPSPPELEADLSRYCDENQVASKWRANVYELLNVPDGRRA